MSLSPYKGITFWNWRQFNSADLTGKEHHGDMDTVFNTFLIFINTNCAWAVND